MAENYSNRKFNNGDVIFTQGDRAGEAYLIKSGKVRLQATENWDTKEIDVIGKGQMFGEMGVVSDMNRMASAIAIEDIEVIACHRKEFLQRLENVNNDRRDALSFLIVYCQDFLPFELMDYRPDDEETKAKDSIAYYLIRDSQQSDDLDDLDMFMKNLYKALVGYAKRRLPPNFKPEIAEKNITAASGYYIKLNM